MDKNLNEILDKRIERTMRALEENQMGAYFVARKEQVVPKVQELLHAGDRVAAGGSMSLLESGVQEHLKCGRYDFLDRSTPGLSKDEIRRIQLESFGADAYLCSVNAVTEKGELYLVDGNGNRTAAVIFGPTRVILVVGVNKIVSDLESAVRRVKETAAPANCMRLDCPTYCREKGVCAGINGGMTAGCSEGRICCDYVVLARQRIPGRIQVILVGEALGY